jgi:Leucine-rich repeat (LRR) protein
LLFHSFPELAPRIFYKLQNLKELDLSGNRLQHIDGAVFADIPSLEVFSCNQCSLVQVTLPLLG